MNWKFCPHCGGALSATTNSSSVAAAATLPQPYDQTRHWKRLLAIATTIGEPPATTALVERIRAGGPDVLVAPVASIVHIVMDRPVTPAGGAILKGVTSDGRLGPLSDLNRLHDLGYVIEDDKVKHIDDVPVGAAFVALQAWGGTRQYRRWHLREPICINASRHGDPFFMDDRLIAFGAVWDDLTRLDEAVGALVERLQTGVDGVTAGRPVLVDIVWRPAESSPPARE